MERKALWRIFDGCILKIHACVQYKKREEKKNIDFSLAPTLDPNLGQPRNFCLLFLELKKWCFPKAASTRVRYLHHSLSELGVLALLHTPQPQPLLDYYQYSLTTLPPVRTYFIMSSPATSPPNSSSLFARVARKLRYKKKETPSGSALHTPSTSSSATSFQLVREQINLHVADQHTHQHAENATSKEPTADTHPECLICLETICDEKKTIPMGCACRGDAGYGHISCKVEAAKFAGVNNAKAWHSKANFQLCFPKPFFLFLSPPAVS